VRLLLLAAAAVLLAPALAGCSSSPGGGDGAGAAGAHACDSVTRASSGVPSNHSVVAIATDHGCIVAELYDDKSPVTARNFLNYTREGFYNDTLIHRVSKQFVLQGGGTAADGSRKSATHPPIVNEARTSGLHNLRYTFSMARTSQPNSATSEFFINVKDNSDCLDAFTGRCDPSGYGYAVFAKVVQGTDAVDAIHAVTVTTSAAHPYCIGLEDSQGGSCPVDPVVVHSARVVATANA
jgi:cyclophilin family peptidyl-prolyl cis-trans isomerase